MASSAPLHPIQRRNSGSSVSIHDTRIAGLYDLEKTIGKGHFAVVKLARHVFTGAQVAVKVIDKTKLDPVSTQHIMQEVRCMKLVQHPAIVRLYEVIDTATKLFLILELGDYDMYDYIQLKCADSGGLPELEVQRHFAQIIDAIDYCHQLHVVHRDLKPENVVFFESMGMVKLTDFGFSNVYMPGEQLDTSCGSLAYSAPEILLGDSYDAPAVDVWSLGVILYMLACGKLPFNEATDTETLTKIMDCKYTFPPNSCSAECKRIIGGLLVRDPAKRSTLREIAADPWVRAGNAGHSEKLPLVGREHLSDDDHDTIVEQMVLGGIGTNEEIHEALEKDDYSHVTATYYLLTERVLRSAREAQAASLAADSQLARSNPDLRAVRLDSVSEEEPITPTPESKVGAAAADEMHSVWARQRSISMVKEESEEEIALPGGTSRKSSRATSPSTSLFSLSSRLPAHLDTRMSPSTIQEMLDVTGRVSSSGRRTPDSVASRGSRSPSPNSLVTPSAIMHRLKTVSIASANPMRKMSSSPHLREIFEEGEEDLSISSNVSSSNLPPLPVERESFVIPRSSSRGESDMSHYHRMRRTGATYSSVRMIRPRHAVVSPDVIRRYERSSASPGPSALSLPPTTAPPPASRSRRSTSCSSSEASDDETRMGIVKSRHCSHNNRRHRKGPDEDDQYGGACKEHKGVPCPTTCATKGKSSGTKCETSSSTGSGTTSGTRKARGVDAGRLLCELQSLALAPIQEMPLALPRFLTRRGSSRSCQHKLSADRTAIDTFIAQFPSQMNTTKAWCRLRRARSCPSLAFEFTADEQEQLDDHIPQLSSQNSLRNQHRHRRNRSEHTKSFDSESDNSRPPSPHRQKQRRRRQTTWEQLCRSSAIEEDGEMVPFSRQAWGETC